MLDGAFFPLMWTVVAIPAGTRPEIFLAAWLYESDLEPSARNAIGCVGLNQTCPKPGGPGFPNDDAEGFRAMPASYQLSWIAPQVLSAIALNGGPFRSAARYYQANFLPATLATAKAPGDVIAGRGGPYAQAYAANAQLDVNGDGAITLDDLAHALEAKILASGTKLSDAIAQVYAAAPEGAPWAAPDLVLFEPASSTGAIARGGGKVLVAASFGLGALALAMRGARRP